MIPPILGGVGADVEIIELTETFDARVINYTYRDLGGDHWQVESPEGTIR
jgi:hypothetical protein